tara:strand:- start:165 stop:788 length:624 start_codon:yes stop_codon:yes gene_type:complete
VAYVAADDPAERTKLYIEFIQPAFDELVNKIIYTYKFTSLPNVEQLAEECKIWLTTILDKYDQTKGTKAFSYFTVVTKNWFIHKVKKNAQQNRREVYYDDMSKELELNHLSTENEYESLREDREFWIHLWQEIESWDAANMKPNEKKVLEAVKVLLKHSEEIEIFNKKAIYLYMREITGLNTKQVVNNLNKMRIKYRVFKRKWEEEI